MAFIYKITNKVNSKVYIGKTEQTVEKRYKEHIADRVKERCKSRPLYRAMNKYGIDNFTVETLEEVFDAPAREIYWITFYDSYNNGYNATLGGDGSKYINEEIVLDSLLKNNLECVATSKELSINHKTVTTVARKYGFFVAANLKGMKRKDAVLSEQDVLQIRKLYIPGKFGKHKIAKLLNLPLEPVNSVIRGKSWDHTQLN